LQAPSKKIAVAFVFAVLIVGIGVFLLYRKNNQFTIDGTPEIARSISQSEVFTKDTDGDGLKDWEEELWKTDKTISDTDGDGTPDGEEIKEGRDPSKKGPDDTLDTETIEKKINKITEADLSETDKFSRELFAKYIGAKQNQSDPRFDDLITNVLEKNIVTQATTSYKVSDLTIIIGEQPAVLKAYGNAMGSLLTRKEPTKLEHELVIVDRAVKNDTPEELLKLNANIDAYRAIEEGLLAIEVPEIFAETHLALLNAVHTIIRNIEGMKLVWSDPVKATGLVSSYPEASEQFVKSLKSITALLRDKKVSFQATEDGYRFVRSI
jgi:hypothetical protein